MGRELDQFAPHLLSPKTTSTGLDLVASATAFAPDLSSVAINALERRDVAQVDRVLELFVSLMADGALQFGQIAQSDRMLERAVGRVWRCSS
jgi:hypothetical protein